jgi:hypothetical protein
VKGLFTPGSPDECAAGLGLNLIDTVLRDQSGQHRNRPDRVPVRHNENGPACCKIRRNRSIPDGRDAPGHISDALPNV